MITLGSHGSNAPKWEHQMDTIDRFRELYFMIRLPVARRY